MEFKNKFPSSYDFYFERYDEYITIDIPQAQGKNIFMGQQYIDVEDKI